MLSLAVVISWYFPLFNSIIWKIVDCHCIRCVRCRILILCKTPNDLLALTSLKVGIICFWPSLKDKTCRYLLVNVNTSRLRAVTWHAFLSQSFCRRKSNKVTLQFRAFQTMLEKRSQVWTALGFLFQVSFLSEFFFCRNQKPRMVALMKLRHAFDYYHCTKCSCHQFD